MKMSTATVDTTYKCSRVMIVAGVRRDLGRVEEQCDKIFASVTRHSHGLPDLSQGSCNLFILAFGDPIQKLIVGPAHGLTTETDLNASWKLEELTSAPRLSPAKARHGASFHLTLYA